MLLVASWRDMIDSLLTLLLRINGRLHIQYKSLPGDMTEWRIYLLSGIRLTVYTY